MLGLNGNSPVNFKTEVEDGSQNILEPEFKFISVGSSAHDDCKSQLAELSMVDNSKESEFPQFSGRPMCNSIGFPSAPLLVGSRRSAFKPYKPSTVLTNLQRGNIKTQTFLSDLNDISWYEQAGQGDLTLEQTKEAGVEIDRPDDNGLTALMWAASYGQTRTVNLLISGGADVNYIGTSGETALLLAAAGGHLDVIKTLLFHNADVNHEDFTGTTALMYAAHGDHPHAVNELLVQGARFAEVNNDGDTAYSIAVERDSVLAIPVLESHLTTLILNEISSTKNC